MKHKIKPIKFDFEHQTPDGDGVKRCWVIRAPRGIGSVSMICTYMNGIYHAGFKHTKYLQMDWRELEEAEEWVTQKYTELLDLHAKKVGYDEMGKCGNGSGLDVFGESGGDFINIY